MERAAVGVHGYAFRQGRKPEAPIGHQDGPGVATALQRRLDAVQRGGDAGAGDNLFDGAVAEPAQEHDKRRTRRRHG